LKEILEESKAARNEIE